MTRMSISPRRIPLRFVKFCAVGASGVLVNLGMLGVFCDVLGFHVNLSSALAIEASINSNFLINELWTFRDRRQRAVSAFKRLFRFHLVSLVGGIIQWFVFIGLNAVWVLVFNAENGCADSAGHSVAERFFIDPVLHPQDVGCWKYASQLFGIVIATFWNYIANFHWTWAWPGSKG